MPFSVSQVAAAPLVPRVQVTDLGSPVHDLVVSGGSVWATLPAQNRASELELADLDEQRRVLVGSSPRGIDVLDDGKLAIALVGATGYVELDPATEELRSVTLPLLGARYAWDVANIGNDKVLVSTSPASTSSGYVVRVDRSDDWSSSQVVRATDTPVFAVAGTTILIGHRGIELFRLDGGDPSLPVVASAEAAGASQLALAPDGSRAYLGSGRVVRTSDLTTVATTVNGYPVVAPSGSTVYSVSRDSITAFETGTYSSTAFYSIVGCGFGTTVSAASMATDTTMVVASGSRICRIDLEQEPGSPTTPHTVDDPTPTPTTPRTTPTDLGTSVHDIVVRGSSLWATLPQQNRVSELEVADLDELRRVLVGAGPRGIDVLDDGKLAIALYDATGYVELDPDTLVRHSVTLPLLHARQTWDVANVGNNRVLVSSNPSSSNSAFVVSVDRNNNWSSTRVADQRVIRSGPVFADAGDTVLVGEGDASLYRLESANLSIAVQDHQHNAHGTEHLTISPDGARAYLGGPYTGLGEVVRTSDIIPVGVIGGGGHPVIDPTGDTVYVVEENKVVGFETGTYSAVAEYDISACGFPHDVTNTIHAAVMPTTTTMFVALGSRICRIDLDQEPGSPATPHTVDDPTPTSTTPWTTVSDLGSGVHDFVINGSSLWATLPDTNQAVELTTVGLDETRRVTVGSKPRGIDVLDDGQLAIALWGGSGYVELDPHTAALRQVNLATPEIWDVANIGNNKVLVSSTSFLQGIQRVDRSDNWKATRVASGRRISDGPVFVDAGTTVIVGEGSAPGTLYRLDGTDPRLPIVAEVNQGLFGGTRLAITADGTRVYATGQAVRTTDLTIVGSIQPSHPVLNPTGTVAYAVQQTSVTAFETDTFSAIAQYDLSGCGFNTSFFTITEAAMSSDTTMFVAADNRICRIDLTTPSPTIGTAATAGGGRATVSWSPPTFDAGSPIAGYIVTPYVGTVPQGPRYFASTATTQTITGLTNGTTYRFRVRAWTDQGVSGFSKVSNPVTPAVGAPYAPTIGVATSGDTTATVTWAAPAYDGGTPILGYVVIPYVGLAPQRPRYFASTATTQTITGLTNGTTYRFRVRAWNSVGASDPSRVTAPVTPQTGA
jgi:hypothetical protein